MRSERRLPAPLAYALVAVNVLLFIGAVANLTHSFRQPLAFWLTLPVAVCDIGLGVGALLWMRRGVIGPPDTRN